LVRSGLVSSEQVNRAIEHQSQHGGRIGECLVATDAITQDKLEAFLRRPPAEPVSLQEAGVDPVVLMGLLLKVIYSGRLETERQFCEAIKLPYPIVADLVHMAVDRKLLTSLGSRHPAGIGQTAYELTEQGRRWTVDLLSHSGYVGPAPVTLEEFTDQVNRCKLSNEVITYERIRQSTSALTLDDSLIEQCGPALNSGRAILFYGLSGNGKTSLAHCLADVFDNVVYMPYAMVVEGQVIRIFDPSLHQAVQPVSFRDEGQISLVREVFDARWVPCSRPFVVAGGELTLDMLDLRYDPVGHFYEAPLHVKALGGCFIIDDFGHQMVSPTNLLNRWIVPLENRIDYLKLHTGKTFSVPFEELIIFSTNLEPRDLMDPAFLRRIPYKIQIAGPTLDAFRTIFEKECARAWLDLPPGVFDTVVKTIRVDRGAALACYQPRFIVDQVVASCRFVQQAPHFEPRFLDYALENLCINHASETHTTAAV